VLTQGTADDKHDKNHRDLRAADVEREVERIVGLGRPCSPITRDRAPVALAHPR
jgi:hypothetical protein